MRKIAVVTGGSRGIGLSCAEAFARDGWSVIALSRHPSDAISSLQQEGLDICWLSCDVSSPSSVEEAFDTIERRYHRVDALINNAGISLIRLFTDTTEQDWQQVMSINLDGAYRCTRAVLPGMISRQHGCIVNVSSMWGEVGASCEVAYSASKAALIGMTKALAKEVGPSGIRVNCITPGVIDTEMNAELADETREELAQETPVGRIGKPEEIAKAILFLAGEQASFITGQVLGISGGLVI